MTEQNDELDGAPDGARRRRRVEYRVTELGTIDTGTALYVHVGDLLALLDGLAAAEFALGAREVEVALRELRHGLAQAFQSTRSAPD